MDIIVRSATTEDLASLVALNEVVQQLHAEAEPAWFLNDTDIDAVEGFFAKILTTERMFVFIAERWGQASGYIWFERQERAATPFTKSRTRIYIHHIVVDPASRKSGVGTTLLRAAETEARAQGIAHIALDTWAFNRDAKAFFQAVGFEPFNVVMRKDVGVSP